MDMKRLGIICAFGVWLVAGAVVATADAPATSSAIDQVAALEATRQQAMVAADVDRLAELLAPDMTYVHSTGLMQSRDDLLGVLKRGEIRYKAFKIESVSYRAYGSTVVGTGVQTLDLEASGKPLTSRSRFTVVYAPVDGRLQLIAYQSTSMPQLVMQETIGK